MVYQIENSTLSFFKRNPFTNKNARIIYCVGTKIAVTNESDRGQVNCHMDIIAIKNFVVNSQLLPK